MSNRLSTLVASWEAGDASFDRGALAKALAADPEVEDESRLVLYKWLVLGPAKREAPSEFAQFLGTMPPAASLDDDIRDLAAALDLGAERTDLVREIQGLMEYLCVKTGAKYEAALCQQLAPLVRAALDGHCTDGTPDLRTTFNVWLGMRQTHVPAAINLRSYREVLDVLYGLVLQYHDPELALHLERNQASITAAVIDRWLPSLYASQGSDLRATLHVWDAVVLAREADEAFVPLIALALVHANRESILAATGKSNVLAAVDACRFTRDTVQDILASTRKLLAKTPFSARRQLRTYVMQQIDAATLSSVGDELTRLQSFVVLPVDADELTDAFSCSNESLETRRPQHLNYVVLDCRAEKSFHHARLPTAVHVGNYIGFDPEMLQKMVAEFESARGSHLCVLGTGRGMVEELNLLKVIALTFVQASFPHVSFADGGFKACVPRIKAGKAEVVRTPAARGPTASETSSAAAGSPQAAVRNESDGAAEAHQNRQQLLAEEAKEKLRAAQARAAENLQAAKSWGMGLMSRWRKPAPAADAPQPQDSAAGREELAAASNSSERPPIQLTTTAGSSSPAPRGSTGSAASGASPAPKAPAGAPSAERASGAALFGEDDDDDDFGLVSSVPAPAAQKAPEAVEESAADEEPAEAEASGAAEAVAEDLVVSAAADAPEPTAAPVTEAAPEETEGAPAGATEAPAAVPAPAPAPAKTEIDDPFGDFEAPAPVPAPKAASTEAKASVKPATKSAEPHPFDDIFGD